MFRTLLGLRSLAFGGAGLEELRRGDLSGVSQLEELTVLADNMTRFGPTQQVEAFLVFWVWFGGAWQEAERMLGTTLNSG